jgi:KDO2-lipid IV(A) lauroyltransferase
MTSYITYLFLRGFSLFVNFLPEGFALWLGRQLGRMAFYMDWGHRKISLENLRTAFKQEKTEQELYAIAQRTFQNLGMMAVEFFRIPRMDVETFKKNVRMEGLGKALGLLEEKRGGLLLIGHFGNWELMGLMSRVIGNPIMVIAKPMKKNRWVDEFITKIRNAAGLEVISNVKASRKVVKALNRSKSETK